LYPEAFDQFGKAFESVGNPGVFAAVRERYARAAKGEVVSTGPEVALSPYVAAILYAGTAPTTRLFKLSNGRAKSAAAGWST